MKFIFYSKSIRSQYKNPIPSKRQTGIFGAVQVKKGNLIPEDVDPLVFHL